MNVEFRRILVSFLGAATLFYPVSLSYGGAVQNGIKTQKSLRSAESNFGRGSLKLVRYLNRAAAKSWQKGQNKKAIQLYQRVLSIQKKRLGYNHPDTLRTIGRLTSLDKSGSAKKNQKHIADRLSVTRRKTEVLAQAIKRDKRQEASFSNKYRFLKGETAKLRKRIASKKQELIRLEEKRRAARQKIPGLKAKWRNAQNKLAGLNAALSSKKRVENGLRDKVNRLKREESRARSALSDARNKGHHDQRALKKTRAKIRKLSAAVSGGGRLRRLRRELSQVRAARGAVRGKLARLSRQKNAISRKLRRTKDVETQGRLRQQLARIAVQERRVRSSASGSRFKISRLQRQISSLNQSIGRAKGQLANERKKLFGLLGRERQIKRRVRQAQRRLKTVQAKLGKQLALLGTAKRNTTKAKKQVAAYQQKTRQLKSQLHSAKHRVDLMKNKIVMNKKGISKYQTRLSQVNSQMSAIQNTQVTMRRSVRQNQRSLRQSRQQERNLTNSLRVVKRMQSRIEDQHDSDPGDNGGYRPKPLTASSEQVVRVYYGTDRNDLGVDEGTDRYGAERATFSYGYSDVAIPPNHVPGELETYSWLKFEFKQNPKKHVTLTHITRLERDDFFETLKGRVDSTESRDAFIFVHGYYNSFKDAARRTAQMTFDMGFEGAPIMYSWPSQGTAKGYVRDESNVEWGELHLQDFILDIIRKTKPSRLHLIAHSMGSRALAKSLVNLRQELTDKEQERLKEIILAAPDIDAATFFENIAPKIMQDKARITLYTSKKDKALQMSERFNGFGRLGNMRSLKKVPDGIDVIDATDVTTSFVGHSYFGSNKSIITDMRAILVFSTPLDKRCYLKSTTNEIGHYWLFVLGACGR